MAGTLKQIIDAPDTKAFDGEDVVARSIRNLLHMEPTEAEMRDYRAYCGDRFVESMAYVRAYQTDLPALRERPSSIQTPVLTTRSHPAARHADLLHGSLPHRRLAPLDSGHIAWEDAAEHYGAVVNDRIGHGYRNV